jgi:signal transduction histidine kinase
MTLRAKLVALVVGLTVALLAGLGLYLAASFSGWSDAAVERDLSARAEALARRVEVKRSGELEVEDAEHLLEDPAHPYRILAQGEVALASRELPWPAADEDGVALVQDREGRGWRVVTRLLEAEGHHRTARVAVQVAGVEAPFGLLEERFRHGLALALLATLVLGGGAAAVVAHRALAPLRRLAGEVDAIGATSLDRRVGARGLDLELRRVAIAFNELLARLDQAMQRQRAFVSRASHALRTPTATILASAEVALRRERTAAEYRAALEEIAVAARESAALVSHLLTLSRLDERRGAPAREPVALDALAAELLRLLGPRAAEVGVALEADVPPGLGAVAERPALRELLEALLDNALRYTPRGGQAGLRARAERGAVSLVVWDTGPGIPADERPLAFERFRRGRAAETSGAPGSGLGLAIVKAIADAHGAEVTLGERTGGGLEVTVLLPAAQALAV